MNRTIKTTTIKCPYCKTENDVEIDKSLQILDVHRDDSVLGTLDDPKECNVLCKNEKCQKYFHVKCFKGNIVGKYKHPLENLINILTLHSNRIRIDNPPNIISIGLRWLVHYKYIALFSLGFISFTILPNCIFYIFGYSDLIGEYWDIPYGVSGGITLAFCYFLILRIKKIAGSLEENIDNEDLKFLEYGIFTLTNRKQLIIIFIIIYFFIVADNSTKIEMWIYDSGSVGKNLITAIGIQIFVSYILILSYLQKINLKGRYFDLYMTT